ncbi:uncharacterized protein LOC143826404 [Paroedura picta]|uniref:uncharacterized protein LOC143826404 n=1 Tax=Paroedura picta TaxID=143630 RepID=UPI004055BE30
MGNWTSLRKLEETGGEHLKLEPARGSQGLGLMKVFRRSQWAPRKMSPVSSEVFYHDLEPMPKDILSWGRRGARLQRATQKACPPLPSLSLWVSGDGGEREENYRYHRLMGNLVSTTVPEDELPPPTWYEVPSDRVVGPPPPPPLRFLTNGMIMAEGHPSAHLNLHPVFQEGE